MSNIYIYKYIYFYICQDVSCVFTQFMYVLEEYIPNIL